MQNPRVRSPFCSRSHSLTGPTLVSSSSRVGFHFRFAAHSPCPHSQSSLLTTRPPPSPGGRCPPSPWPPRRLPSLPPSLAGLLRRGAAPHDPDNPNPRPRSPPRGLPQDLLLRAAFDGNLRLVKGTSRPLSPSLTLPVPVLISFWVVLIDPYLQRWRESSAGTRAGPRKR